MASRLITFKAESRGYSTTGMEVTTLTPIEWLADMQKYIEIYFILSVVEITDKEAKKYAGELKGM